MPTSFETARTLLLNAKRVVLYPRSSEDTDAIASACALAELLDSHGITATIVLEREPTVPLAFLAGARAIKTKLELTQTLTIDIPLAAGATAALSYERSETGLRVHVVPSQPNTLTTSGVTVQTTSNVSADLVVVLGVRRLQDLGPRFTKNTEQFYRRPIIAISPQVDAESFATVHLGQAGARSCAEITHALLSNVPSALTPTIATALLTGVFAESQSFQRGMTSPQEFDLAAELLEHGANRHVVVQHLYKTKPLPVLKLWGRLLSRLGADPLERVWVASIRQVDFAETRTQPDQLVEVMRDVLTQSSQAQLIAVVYELARSTSGAILVSPRETVIQRVLTTLETHAPISAQKHNGHMAHVRLQLTLSEAARVLHQVGEQITRPGYTEPRDGTRRQQSGQQRGDTALAAAGRPTQPQPKLAA